MTVSQPTRGTPALLTHGYTVLAAADGAQALEAADAHAGPIHVLLTDVVMPVWTGWQLAREFRTRRPLTRVLYMTGYAEMPEAPDAPVLQKPFTCLRPAAGGARGAGPGRLHARGRLSPRDIRFDNCASRRYGRATRETRARRSRVRRPR